MFLLLCSIKPGHLFPYLHTRLLQLPFDSLRFICLLLLLFSTHIDCNLWLWPSPLELCLFILFSCTLPCPLSTSHLPPTCSLQQNPAYISVLFSKTFAFPSATLQPVPSPKKHHLLGQGHPVRHVVIKRATVAHTAYLTKTMYSTASWNSLVVSGGKGHI